MAKGQTVSKIKDRLSSAGELLGEIASRLAWIYSKQNHIPYELLEEIEQRKDRKIQRQYIYYLKRQKLIEIQKIGTKLRLHLTEKGWQKALRDRIKTTEARCKNGSCFLLFDIPEKERVASDMLREFLKECGFKRLQHSVWMTDRDILEPLKQLLQRHKLERWIRIIVGDIVPASPLDHLTLRKYRT